MAKKKLNKKVAIAGSIVLAVVIALITGYLWYKSIGPQMFIDDGDAAVAAKDYESAIKQYGRALSRAKNDNELQKKILFKLADIHTSNNDWRKAIACWSKVEIIDTSDTTSRINLLNFFYDMADSGQYSVWKKVQTTVDELLPLAPEARFYLIKARAKLELAKGGEVVDKIQALNETIEVLQKAQNLDANNPAVYRYLADAVLAKGEATAAKGSPEDITKAQKQAQKLLEKAIAIAPKDPNSYIQLLNVKLIAAGPDKKQIGSLEPDYIALTKKFPESSDVFAVLNMYYNYYNMIKQDVSDIDKALTAARKAMELSPQSVKYAVNAADMYYRKGSLDKDAKCTQKAVDIAKNALTFPDANDKTQGSREYANKTNKLSLNTFLAHRYIEQLLALPADAPKQQKDAIIADAEQAIHAVSQIWGSGEHLYVVELDGMLTFAKGDNAEGIRKMYTAYQQLKQSDTKNQDVQLAQLSYMLATAFANSSEIGATRDFLFNALQRRIFFTKPESLLLYAQVCLNLRLYGRPGALDALDMYETIRKPDAASQLLRARANIGNGEIDKAEALLAKMKAGDPNVASVKLTLLQTKIEQASAANRDANAVKMENAAIQAEIDRYRNEQIEIARQLVRSDPNATQAIAIICENYISKNKIQEAKAVVGDVLSRDKNNTVAAFYKLLLAEPDPNKTTAQRREYLTEQALTTIAVPDKRYLALAEYYKSKGAFDKAISEYKKTLETDPANKIAIAGIFESALQAFNAAETQIVAKQGAALEQKDPNSYLKLAADFSAVAKRENTDSSGGQLFMARLAITKKDYKDALSRLDVVLKERPVFSFGYLLRSTVNAELGNEQLAIEDARKAIEINPIDGGSAKNLANLLYQRNRKLGQNVSTEQIAEAQAAVERAWLLNPREWQLLSFFAEYIKDTDPMRALAIRQKLQTAIPTAQNAALLGNLAMKMAAAQRDVAKQKAYVDMAAAAYEQGYKIDPNDAGLLKSYAEFYSMTGRQQQAEQLLGSSSNKNLLWVHQIKIGQFEQAKATLDALYKQTPKNTDILKGLMLVAQNLGDTDGVMKYSQELLSFENTPENQLGQIEAFLQVSLVDKAEKQLASYMEKHPNDDRTILLQAWLAIKKGQFTEAIVFIKKNLELKPNDSVSWNLKGQIDFARGNFDDAIDDFKKARDIAPGMQPRISLARAYLRAGRGDDAAKELIVAIDESPGATNLYFMLEETYQQLGKADALSRFYTDAIKKFPDTPFWYNRAASFALSRQNFDAAMPLCKAALEASQKANPNIPKEAMLQQSQMALDNYLELMRLKKQYDQLIAYASQYVDSDMAFVAFAAMADAKAELGDKAKAFEYYNKALLKAASDDNVVFNILKKMTAAVGRDETVKWCTEQLKTTPDSLPINLAMCNLARSNNETGKALLYIDKCLQLAKQNPPLHRKLTDTKQAILVEAYKATSDDKYFKEAVKLYEEFIAGSSSVEAGALNNLAYLLASNDRDIDKAVEYSARAYDVVQNNPNILDTYAYVLYKKGDYKKASELVRSAAQMFERTSVSAPPEVYEHLGMISAKLGNKTEAVNAYKQALKVGEKTLSDEQKKSITAAIEALK